MSDDKADELRPIDHIDEAVGKSAEAAELAEHIRDSDPTYTREQQLNLLVQLIDQSHERALTASVRLDNAN